MLHFYCPASTQSSRSSDVEDEDNEINSTMEAIEHMRRSRAVLFSAVGLLIRARSSDTYYASLNAIFDILHTTTDVDLVPFRISAIICISN